MKVHSKSFTYNIYTFLSQSLCGNSAFSNPYIYTFTYIVLYKHLYST
nr:MAG TPA: hypothetical protein [Caudoviricetes sp.]